MTFSSFHYLHFSSQIDHLLSDFMGVQNFKNGIFRTEEGSVLISEQYLPPF
nr:MAG TPA: hypothetical protein [Caudoviricetes sp.]